MRRLSRYSKLIVAAVVAEESPKISPVITLLSPLHKRLCSQSCNNPRETWGAFDQLAEGVVAPRGAVGRAVLDVWVGGGGSGAPNWPSILHTCVSRDRSLSRHSFGGVLMGLCLKHKQLGLAQSYLQWEEQPSVSALSLYLRLLAEGGAAERDILQLFHALKRATKGVWTVDIGERAIVAVCTTGQWEESLEILRRVSVGGSPSLASYAAAVKAAFAHGQTETGWRLLQEIPYRTGFPQETLCAWLEAGVWRGAESAEEGFERLLDFLESYEVTPAKPLIQAVCQFAASHLNYQVHETTVKDGRCGSCGAQLDNWTLSEGEFTTLRDHFMHKVVERGDLFLNTSPQELDRFKKQLSHSPRFDFVLDGLNLGYIDGRGVGGAGRLLLFVRHLAVGGARLLVVGRKHMGRWNREHMAAIAQLATVVLLEDSSNDDPFVVWATLASGQQAKFLSRDFMRNHRVSLGDPVLGQLFKRWRLGHQLYPSLRGSSGKSPPRVELSPYASAVPVLRREGRGVHVPFSATPLSSPHQFPHQWVCLAKQPPTR